MTLIALIFDVDGTLAETEELHRNAFNKAFDDVGLDWFWDQPLYKTLLRTTGGKERIEAYQRTHLAGEPGLTPGEIADLHKAKTAHYVDMMEDGELNLRPGVRTLMEEARADGIGLAVATSTSYPNIDALCRCCWSKDAADVFDVIAAGDEVAQKKPMPDVFLLALMRLGLSPDLCVAFEDSKNGLMSSNEAGLRTIVTPGMYTADEEFCDALAVYPKMPRLKQVLAAF